MREEEKVCSDQAVSVNKSKQWFYTSPVHLMMQVVVPAPGPSNVPVVSAGVTSRLPHYAEAALDGVGWLT